MKFYSPYRVINSQLGVGCNEGDEIVIEDFRGYLTWSYAQKTPARQSFLDRLEPMTADNGGFTPMVTVRCDKWPKGQSITMTVGDEVYLPDCKGEKIRLEYAPVDHVAVVLLNSEERGILRRAG